MPHAPGLLQHVARPPLRSLTLAGAALAAVMLPGWLHGVPPAGWWGPLAALLALLAATRCGSSIVLLCLAALALGMQLDFASVPPVVLMSLCGAPDQGWWQMLLSHLRMFPATSLLMLGLLLPRALQGPRRWLLAGAALAGMPLAMMLAMELFKRAAVTLGGSWGPDGWACAMAAGMLGFEVIFRRSICTAHT
jgi:hypothetical protein